MNQRHVDFEKPPLVEVSIGIQFADLPIRTADIGFFRDLCVNELQLTKYEEQLPLERRVENFEPVSPRFPEIRIESLPPLSRQWFSSEDGTKLVQFQRDRLIYNWRRTPDDEYPRYPAVKESFKNAHECFSQFLQKVLTKDQRLLDINQCEIAYFNHIESEGIWNNHSELDRVIRPLDFSTLRQFDVEDSRFGFRTRLKSDQGVSFGRIYVNVTPAFRSSDSCPLVSVDITARGNPEENDLAGALRFFDVGHQEITSMFAALTTPEMHRSWERRK